MTKVSQHHGFKEKKMEQLIGAHCYRCHHDFEKEDVRDFADSQWWDLHYQGRDKKRFQYCADDVKEWEGCLVVLLVVA